MPSLEVHLLSTLPGGGPGGGRRGLHPAHPGGAHHAGGEAAAGADQEEGQDRGAGGVHRQPAGPRDRREAQHPAGDQLRQASVGPEDRGERGRNHPVLKASFSLGCSVLRSLFPCWQHNLLR